MVWNSNFIVFGGQLGGKAVQMYNNNVRTWSALAPMTYARSYFSCVLLPSRSMILVLSTAPGINETTAELYDPVSNTWASTGSTQYARAGSSLVVLRQRVFALGGNWSPSPTSLSSTVEEYNIIFGTWSLARANLLGSRKSFGAVSVPAALFDNLPQGCVGV